MNVKNILITVRNFNKMKKNFKFKLKSLKSFFLNHSLYKDIPLNQLKSH